MRLQKNRMGSWEFREGMQNISPPPPPTIQKVLVRKNVIEQSKSMQCMQM
jgi:hypothetical protein